MFTSAARRGSLAFVAGGGLDVSALDWNRRVAAAGGTVSGRTLAAVSNFCRAAKVAGYWSKLNRLNLFCGNQLAASLVPLKAGSGSATETNVGFLAGDYTEATGLTSGASKYLRTGLVASTALTANDTHLAFYNRSAVNAQSGITTAGASEFIFYQLGTWTSDQYNSTAGQGRATVVAAANTGLGIATRTGAASHAIYRNGASIVSNATAGGALPAFEAYIFTYNNSGAAGSSNASVGGAYSIGSGLSATDAANYYTHMQAFQTALGRNV